MSELTVSSEKSLRPPLPESVIVLCLFCFLGLLISAAVLPMYSPSDVTWVMDHLE